jgi:hypothetical protein
VAEEYIILIREPEWDPSTSTESQEDAGAAVHAAHSAFFEAIAAAGATFLDGAGLMPPSTAVRIVPARNGSPAVFTDGPFGETKEIISGYYKIGTKDAVSARELAALCPTDGWIELYPVADVGM